MARVMKQFGIAMLLGILLKTCTAGTCDGVHEYVDEVGVCRTCEMCGPGHEPTKYLCGYGTKESGYTCQKCPAGTFSSATNYNYCVTCSPCGKWNSKLATTCKSISDSKCGDCLNGYFRPRKSDGQTDAECFKCKPDSTNLECSREDVDWKLITVVMSCVVVFLLVLLMVCYCIGRKANSHNSGSKVRNSVNSNHSSMEPLTTTSISEGLPKVSTPPDPPVPCDPNTYSNLSTALFYDSGAYPNLPTSQFGRTEITNVPNTTSSHPSYLQPVANCELNTSNNRLDEAYCINVDSFDTNSLQRSFVADKKLQAATPRSTKRLVV